MNAINAAQKTAQMPLVFKYLEGKRKKWATQQMIDDIYLTSSF